MVSGERSRDAPFSVSLRSAPTMEISARWAGTATGISAARPASGEHREALGVLASFRSMAPARCRHALAGSSRPKLSRSIGQPHVLAPLAGDDDYQYARPFDLADDAPRHLTAFSTIGCSSMGGEGRRSSVGSTVKPELQAIRPARIFRKLQVVTQQFNLLASPCLRRAVCGEVSARSRR